MDTQCRPFLSLINNNSAHFSFPDRLCSPLPNGSQCQLKGTPTGEKGKGVLLLLLRLLFRSRRSCQQEAGAERRVHAGSVTITGSGCGEACITAGSMRLSRRGGGGRRRGRGGGSSSKTRRRKSGVENSPRPPQCITILLCQALVGPTYDHAICRRAGRDTKWG